jgi:hypothetical protein
VVAFRHLLDEQVHQVLQDEGMACRRTSDAVVELIVSLSNYREEGTQLFPLVFICDDVAALLQRVEGQDLLVIGQGSREAETVRRALKQCAPLARDPWSIWLERQPGGAMRYGLFRNDAFVLSETPMELFRGLQEPGLHAVGVLQLGDNIVELRGASGAARYVYLSGARSDSPPRTVAFRGLLSAIVRDVPPELRADTWTFYRRVFIDVMRTGHGSLVAVLPAGQSVPPAFADGILLEPNIDLASEIARYRAMRNEASRAGVHARGRLLAGMMGVDGITLLRTDGAIVGYQVFVQHAGAARQSPLIGGARRRTYEWLAEAVGTGLVAAFYRSQDGHMECTSTA